MNETTMTYPELSDKLFALETEEEKLLNQLNELMTRKALVLNELERRNYSPGNFATFVESKQTE